MSAASECDLCGALFKPAGHSVQLEVNVRNADDDTWLTWSDVDFCAACSERVLALIGPAIKDVCPE